MLGADKVSSVKPLCRIATHQILYRPDNAKMTVIVNDMLANEGAIDAVMLGYNGSKEVDRRYDDMLSGPLKSIVALQYKHIFGECYSAPALGVYAAACCMERGEVPTVLRRDGGESLRVRRILIVNYDDAKDCAITLLCSDC